MKLPKIDYTNPIIEKSLDINKIYNVDYSDKYQYK